jgi:hypothetical protein
MLIVCPMAMRSRLAVELIETNIENIFLVFFFTHAYVNDRRASE